MILNNVPERLMQSRIGIFHLIENNNNNYNNNNNNNINKNNNNNNNNSYNLFKPPTKQVVPLLLKVNITMCGLLIVSMVFWPIA